MISGAVSDARDAVRCVRVAIRGVVQGVGFRPFVHRLAVRHGLAGSVRNDSGGVDIVVEGRGAAIDAFVAGLRAEAPPLTRIDDLTVEPAEPAGTADFAIVPSRDVPDRRLPVSPDVAVCAACETELRDPANRRFGYPFITCTDCGPRYTVIESMPYDRERTSMRAFIQCADCAREYADPADRRYHSQTNACPDCGPHTWLVSSSGALVAGEEDAIVAGARLLLEGGILAVRGLGGFHLAVDARNEQAVQRLRRRKHRDAKPLAIMVRSLAQARVIAAIGAQEERLLVSRERPIVLLRARSGAELAPSLAPGLDTIGVMLAYTPLHHLLLDAVKCPLVMTSGNRSEEPIATGNAEALRRLGGIADALLLHDREIISRYDDSVVRVAGGAPIFLRRARGYAPLPVPLPVPAPRPLVAVGPHLKNTFTLAAGTEAFVSQHVGDLENLETLEHFWDSLARFRSLFRIEPTAVARDLHPGYLSTRIADELGLPVVLGVQHHHAHVAAVAAEHGVTEPVVGLAFDGTGYGADERTWGAEILVADLTGFRRAGQLRYAPMPGGDLAARRPWRAALGYLSLDPAFAPAFQRAFDGIPDTERETATLQIRRGLNAPLASSMGRLFDAAAAVLGVRSIAHHEGQAAMEIEALAGDRAVAPLAFPIHRAADGTLVMDPVPLLAELGRAAARGGDVACLAASFHESIARTAVDAACMVCADTGIETVALSGGVFQNARLFESVSVRLEASGLAVLRPVALGPNDGAISYGQAAIAAALLQREV